MPSWDGKLDDRVAHVWGFELLVWRGELWDSGAEAGIVRRVEKDVLCVMFSY